MRCSLAPGDEGSQVAAASLLESPGLVDEEPQPDPHLLGTAVGEPQHVGPPVGEEPVEQLGGGRPPAGLPQRARLAMAAATG